MRTLYIVFFLLFTIIFAVQRTRETYSHPEKRPGAIQKKFSLPILTSVYVTICAVAILELLFTERRIHIIIIISGIVLYTAAFILRSWTFKTLGCYYSPHIEIRDDHPLIIDGPYKYMRHPFYVGVIIELISFVTIANSYYGLLLTVFLYLPILLLRVYQEEKAMVEKFGLSYIEYKKRVYAFLPLKKYPG